MDFKKLTSLKSKEANRYSLFKERAASLLTAQAQQIFVNLKFKAIVLEDYSFSMASDNPSINVLSYLESQSARQAERV